MCEKTANKHAAYRASEPSLSWLSFITMTRSHHHHHHHHHALPYWDGIIIINCNGLSLLQWRPSDPATLIGTLHIVLIEYLINANELPQGGSQMSSQICQARRALPNWGWHVSWKLWWWPRWLWLICCWIWDMHRSTLMNIPIFQNQGISLGYKNEYVKALKQSMLHLS